MIKSSVEFNNTEYHNTTIQLKHATAAEFTAGNPILAKGEMGVETDTDKFKFGDGETPWNALPYAGNGSATPTGSFKYGMYTLSANQTSNLAVGNHIEFDTVQGSLGGLSTGTGQQKGIVTLAAGKTYKITGTIHCDFPSQAASCAEVYDLTHNVSTGIIAAMNSINSTMTTYGIQPMFCSILSPTVDTNICIRIFNPVVSTPSTINHSASHLLIEEYGGV